MADIMTRSAHKSIRLDFISTGSGQITLHIIKKNYEEICCKDNAVCTAAALLQVLISRYGYETESAKRQRK